MSGDTQRTSVFTIGFTRKSARDFFGRLEQAGVRKVIDVRLHNSSQLSGFAKADDLPFFLQKVSGIGYVHEPSLAPTDDILQRYRKHRGSWSEYEGEFTRLMEDRRVEEGLSPDFFQDACLLCSEDKPHHCHRRVVCDYLNRKWGNRLAVRHL